MTSDERGPATELARQRGEPLPAASGPRPFARLPPGASAGEVGAVATRALAAAGDAAAVRHVVATVVRDLGGALVPARFEPDAVLDVDVSLGLGEPLLVVADRLSVTALQLRDVLPSLLEEARAALARLPSTSEQPPAEEPDRARSLGAGSAEALPDYLVLLGRADGDAACALLLRLLDAGTTPADLAAQVLAPAQREVGERWFRGEWSIADEHAATTITERCVALLETAVPAEPHLPLVLVVSPEGEWHGLPARLAAVMAHGTRSHPLTAGTTPADLRRQLDEQLPQAVALSCTMATSLLPAARLVDAAHDVDVPVVAGGLAFGADARRALALGADAWAASPREFAGLLPGLRARTDRLVVPREALLADALPDALLLGVWEGEPDPWTARLNAVQRRRVADDLRWVARNAAAAYAVGDGTVLDEPMRWLRARLHHHGAPDAVLADAVGRLANALHAETPVVAALVAATVDRLRPERDDA